ncbi:phage tail sheath C-terminal domain-containing protein [uncultured Parabacteroides sp.]|uniref:phage tail sheath C-terminal domain-containing protein n=1 Tax=uncultured Parabacteroides sp. TaxID=512312 RepID=UPI0028047D25|nr:phage tail sheath C-terminal domain-containing protein [uncultured Parabacteroides sp.]
MAAMKTPGVYIVEKNAFPNSVVAVPTAVPAFIGHTRFAMDGTKDLKKKPFRITSMLEYETYFGGAPDVDYTLVIPDELIFNPYTIVIQNLEKIKTLKDDIANLEKDESKSEELEAKKKELADEEAKFGIEKQEFKVDVKAKLINITSPAWSVTAPDPNYTLYYNMILYFANGGGACYIVSVGSYTDQFDAKNFTDGINALKNEQEPTMVVVPEAVNGLNSMWKTITEEALMHCGKFMKNRITILDVFNGYKSEKDPNDGKDVITYFRENVGSEYLDFAAAYYPWLDTSVVSESSIDASSLTNPDQLLYILKLEIDWSKDRLIANKMHCFQFYLGCQLIDKDTSITDKDAAKAPLLLKIAKDDKLTMEKAQELAKTGTISDDHIKAAAKETLTVLSPKEQIDLANMLLPNSICGKEIMKVICQQINRLPVAAAMAGIYARTDDARGVWKAPANVSISRAVSPTVNLTDSMQENLNVDVLGRSINAIRYFKGDGIKVWGARTLDGNSLDWRYINVRRTMIFLEESIKNAAKAYVFEPNVASTWLNMKSMIENFLMGVWKQGGLAGASPEDAYSVHVGLGDTMTPEDILEGILRITILVAISRPAEFIEITFQQQMQKS